MELNKKKIDKISIAVIIIMVFCVVLTLVFLYKQNIQECTSNPLPYSAKLYEENFDIARATGTLTLWPNEDDKTTIPTVILFNSTDFWVQDS
jgi:hypothetical protein